MNHIYNKKMENAISLHKGNNLKEATKLYNEVLEIFPENSFANHNLGSILVIEHQSKKALPYFIKALEIEPKIEQFWTSYIDALINLDAIEYAKEMLEIAYQRGFSGKVFDTLTERTLSPGQSKNFFRALDKDYLAFLQALHQKVYEGYFEIGTRRGNSLTLSQSPSIAIDPCFDIKHDPVGSKDYCLLFQNKSEDFFQNIMPNLSFLKCQLAFIDGMHLFEYALKDFINLVKNSSEEALFLFHDPIPFSFEMATRDYNSIQYGKEWTGDIWKLVPILIEAGLKDDIKLLTSSPTGLLAVFSPDKRIVLEIENNYEKICSKWIDIELSEKQLNDFYQTNIFIRPEIYLEFLEQINFGQRKRIIREWISH